MKTYQIFLKETNTPISVSGDEIKSSYDTLIIKHRSSVILTMNCKPINRIFIEDEEGETNYYKLYKTEIYELIPD